MDKKHPKIYKNRIDNLKSKVQSEYYCHPDQEVEKVLTKDELVKKIENLFSSPNFVYQVDINIMLKNGKNIRKKVIALRDNYLITLDNEKILLDEISDIK